MVRFQARIAKECNGGSLLPQVVLQTVDQGRFAGADFAGKQDEPFARFYPIKQGI
jgi:hypothetical protein